MDVNGFYLKTKCRIHLYQEYSTAFIAYMIKINRHIGIYWYIKTLCLFESQNYVNDIPAYLTCLKAASFAFLLLRLASQRKSMGCMLCAGHWWHREGPWVALPTGSAQSHPAEQTHRVVIRQPALHSRKAPNAVTTGRGKSCGSSPAKSMSAGNESVSQYRGRGRWERAF